MSLTVNEVYRSVQGESTYAGLPCTFVRLTACDLRCRWCDTAHAFHEGTRRTVDEILAEVEGLGCPLVEVTGGEPLLQAETPELLRRLCDTGRTVLLETGGHLDVSGVDPRVVRVVDVKCPGSGESHRNRWENLDLLGRRDELKFVIADRRDYEWAREVVRSRDLGRGATVLFSPVWRIQDPAELAGWILEDLLPVRLQLQVHKVLWGEARGR